MSKKIVSLIDSYRDHGGGISNRLVRVLITIEKYRLVRLSWLLGLKLKNRGSGKIKTCFGPVIEREDTLGFRKWGIDPIVDEINRKSKKYVADIFFGDEDLSDFDIVVIVKNFDNINNKIIQRLIEKKTTLIYNPRDNPEGCNKSHEDNKWFVKSMHGIITSNPKQDEILKRNGLCLKQVASPIISRKHKVRYTRENHLKIIWQGYSKNMSFMYRLHPIIKKLAEETGTRICFTYHSERPPKEADKGITKYVKWKISNWEDLLVKSDIGVVIKPMENPLQQRKPPTKILTYMAAGLPTVCTPSEADKLVMKHGESGFFAYTDDEWYNYLKMLIQDAGLRERIGKAARECAVKNYSIEKIAGEYTDFFDSLLNKNK